MRELATSVLSYTLANVLYTGQQVAKFSGVSGNLVTPKNPPAPGSTGEEPNSISSYLYKKTKETVEKFGDPAAVAFIAGDEYQAKAVNFVFDLLSLSTLDPRYWAKMVGRLASQGGMAVNALGPQQSLYAKQAMNTREIFTLVRNNPEKLGIPKNGSFDLAVFLEKAYSVGDFENIWCVEGLGHAYSQRTWSGREDAEGILFEGQAVHIPEKALTMMHAGLGLCLAESLMKQLTPDSSAQETDRVLKTFIKLCRNNSRPGYTGCALESLGLVTRCFNYPMVDPVQRALANLDENAWEFFWRGAGRALYFSPGHMLQPLYSPWIAAEQEAPNERALKILKAGIVWPTNIVNMRHPEIFEDFIRRYGPAEENEGTIHHGVAASTAMAMDITPNHPVVRSYLDYEPSSADPEVRRLWAKLVREPVFNAVNRYQPILKKHKMMDQVFRFQDLDALVDRLEPKSEASQAAGRRA
ncbi:MAG TPA: hypothetical protein VL285_18225 [Bryobacteraceae bacterium]|jgi:hypothetical protein|nr:hypothetical protein [Bryobacteraceae bacterium]